MDELQQHYCAWHHLIGLTQHDRRLLFSQYPNPDAAYSATLPNLQAQGFSSKGSKAWCEFSLKPKAHAAWQQMQAQLPRLQNVSIVSVGDANYPPLLRETPDHPPLLYVRGDVSVLAKPQLAIVGSRRCSQAAQETAFSFAKHLAGQDIVITSGGALGIDTAAHKGAINSGSTIAVMGTGIDGCYPASNAPLYEDIQQNGAVVSEFRPGVSAKAGHFPRRNRIIAGMAVGTLVVEAALRSGSLITAHLALDYNREVFAIPGSVNDPRSKGTHALIKQGAKLTETAEDIFEEFAWPNTELSAPVSMSTPEGPAAQLLEKVDYTFTSLDNIAKRACLPVATLLPQLLELELSGYIAQEDGGYIRR